MHKIWILKLNLTLKTEEIYIPNLVIATWMGDELLYGQTRDWHTETDTHVNRQTQTTTIPEGYNWPRIKTMIQRLSYYPTFSHMRTKINQPKLQIVCAGNSQIQIHLFIKITWFQHGLIQWHWYWTIVEFYPCLLLVHYWADLSGCWVIRIFIIRKLNYINFYVTCYYFLCYEFLQIPN